ncbi:hypothetical protein AU106_gp033 [Sinorhizobium phage phiM9]|uniref:Uncharacterized protein n=1 Tax=Sinorhizobium phage phiM9 TaxID=1636182 RepID=A0A0F6TGP3_9CAUD|nr:hypothetical protein AU106_gp033 [Sinorhizobium phage phiM9]AKE44664.1 hypothetical protein Sm_phiM9_034 [Sinorhizobium phage phiM9]
MNVDQYLQSNYFSRDAAEAAMRDFSTLKRRVNKWNRGTNDALSIYNLIHGIENEFDHVFIDHILATRFNADERKIYGSCLRAKGDKRMKDYNHKFSLHLERDLWKAKFG